MINESRYRLSGSTHRNGMTATSCESLLVVASNSTDAIAGRLIQRSLSTIVTSPAAVTAASGTIGAMGEIEVFPAVESGGEVDGSMPTGVSDAVGAVDTNGAVGTPAAPANSTGSTGA